MFLLLMVIVSPTGNTAILQSGFQDRRPTSAPLLFRAVPAGLPSALLLRRPDVRQAEQELIAANADIGVASTQTAQCEAEAR